MTMDKLPGHIVFIRADGSKLVAGHHDYLILSGGICIPKDLDFATNAKLANPGPAYTVTWQDPKLLCNLVKCALLPFFLSFHQVCCTCVARQDKFV